MNAPLPTKQYDSYCGVGLNLYASLEEMAVAAALDAHAALAEAVERHSTARVIFAAAASQVRFLEVLTSLEGLDWSKVTCFHMDEYLGIPDSHPASFRRFLRERIEHRVRPRKFHYICGDADEPVDECQAYGDLLRAAPIDLCCLGIGENGHIAFNDPHVANFHDPRTVKLVSLDEACRRQQVGEGAFPTIEAVPQYAYTLTVPALLQARKLVCVVPEKRKAEAVRRALKEPIRPACPASFLRRQHHTTVYLDPDSGSLL